MSYISGQLEQANRRLAYELESGAYSGANIDARLVHREQELVQQILEASRVHEADAYRAFIDDISRMLNEPSFLERHASRLYREDAQYMRILESVRRDLGRDIDYENQSDREAIGMAIVNAVRLCIPLATRIPGAGCGP